MWRNQAARIVSALLAGILLLSGCASTVTETVVEAPAADPSTSSVPAVDEPVDSQSDGPESAPAVPEGSTEPVEAQVEQTQPAAALAQITLGTSVVEELDPVTLAGLPDDFDPTLVAVMHVVGDIATPVQVLTDQDGNHYFIAPMNADAPGTAGSAEVFLTNGEVDGPRMTLELTPMPASPGAAAEFAQFFRDRVDAQAQELGSSFEELQGMAFEDAPAGLALLKLQQGIIDDGTENDLMSMFSADESDLSEDEMAVLDSMMAKIDAPAQTPPPPPPPSVPSGATPPPPPASTNSETSGNAPRALSMQVTPGAGECNSSDAPTINDVDDLVGALGTGLAAQRQQSGATGKVSNDIKSMLGQASAIPGAGPWLGAAGAGLSTYLLSQAADAGRYPTALSGLDVDLTVTEFNEDFAEPGTWSNLRVSATSTGYNATGDVIGLTVDSVGIGSGIAKTRNVVTDQTVEQLDAAGRVVNTATGEFLQKDQGPAFAQFCPHTWTVPVEGKRYVTVEANAGLLKIDQDAKTYEPEDLGASGIKFELVSEQFHNLNVGTSAKLETKETVVQLSPTTAEVKAPGEVVDFTVSFINSDSESAEWSASAGQFLDGNTVTEGVTTRSLETPRSADEFDVNVAVVLKTNQGLFRDAARARPDRDATVKLADLIITPADARVGTGKSLQYTATTPNGQQVEVEWSAGGGSISDSGLYLAGDEEGVFNVDAQLVADSSVSATTTVEIVDGDCVEGTWKLRLDEMAEQMSRLTPDGSFLFIDGEYTVVVNSDLTWTATRRDLQFQMMAQGQTVVLKIVSAEAGTYTADGTTLNIVETSSNASAVLVVPGVGEIGGPVPAGGSVGGVGTYECDEDVLRVSADGFTMVMDKVGPPDN